MKKTIFIAALLLVHCVSFAAPKWEIGPHVGFSFPTGDHVYGNTAGEGLGAKVLYQFENIHYLRARADLLYLSYGEQRSSIENTPGLLERTRHESFQLTTGVQFDWGSGTVRSYISPMVGVFNFRSVSTYPDLYYYYGYTVSDTRDSQWTYGGRLQGGLLFDIGLGVLIDVGFNYQRLFDVQIEKENRTFRTDADDLMLNVGVLISVTE
ncbi:MAG: hypothetical protein U5R06_05960 [candidate division KSB1 bacterium]|nr:hypothetical protein [candidate division KSB1 bacterium]